MKLFARFLLTLLLMMTMGVVAHTQSPREQLQQMVQQLQKNPSDNGLRERIIKLAQEIKPPPAIPEEANRAFVRGNVFQKEAKDPSGYDLAIQSYREALRYAPWWVDAYYNLSVAQESAGKFDDAIESLKLFIIGAPSSNDAREAQNRIYALEAKKELARKEQTARAESERKKEQAFIQNLAGIWSKGEPDMVYGYEVYQLEITGNNRFTMKWLRREGGVATRVGPFEHMYSGSVSGRRLSGTWSNLLNFGESDCGVVRLQGTFDGSTSEDGNIIRIKQHQEGVPSCSRLRNPWSSPDITYRKAR